MTGTRKTELMKLKKMFEELKASHTKVTNGSEVGRLGMARDRQGKALRQANERLTKATETLRVATQEMDKALEKDRKATTAYLNNKDKDDESWLEDELEAADKVTKAKRITFVAAKDEFDEAETARDREKVELDKLDQQDEDNFAVCMKLQKEMDAVGARIKAVEKDLKDNPSLGRKIKDLLK